MTVIAAVVAVVMNCGRGVVLRVLNYGRVVAVSVKYGKVVAVGGSS